MPDRFSNGGSGSNYKSDVPAQALQGKQIILIADDEDLVREVSRRVLESHGYRVLEAADGQAALLISHGYPTPIDLLIVMPDLGGQELSRRLKLSHPQMKVLFISGHTDEVLIQHGVLRERVNFLRKPFDADTLVRTVREVLDN